MDQIIKSSMDITQRDDEKRIAFGWASIAVTAGGVTIEDIQRDIIEPEELESAAYRFVELYGEGGEMHQRGDCAVLIESVVFTPEKCRAMGIPDGIMPEAGWWIGFKVTDDAVWAKIKSGVYQMFSIEGKAVREEVGDEDE